VEQEAASSSRIPTKNDIYITGSYRRRFHLFRDVVKLVFLRYLLGAKISSQYLFVMLDIVGSVGQGVGLNEDCAFCMMSASAGVLSFRSNGRFDWERLLD
jgi:hypothetical protein